MLKLLRGLLSTRQILHSSEETNDEEEEGEGGSKVPPPSPPPSPFIKDAPLVGVGMQG
jgi:hypothetical protein